MDQATQAWVRKTVEGVGGNAALAKEFCERAALPAESREVLKELSPIMADAWGVNSKNFPAAALVITLAGWLVGVAMVMINLKQLSRDHARIFAAKPAPAPALVPVEVGSERKN